MAVTANFKAWAAKRDTQKVRAARINVRRVAADAFGPAGTLTLHVADAWGRWDGVNHYQPLLMGVPSVSQESTEITHGVITPSLGSLELAMPGPGVPVWEGAGQPWESLLGGNYDWQGREFTVWVGGPDLAWADWAVALTGYLGAPTFTRGRAVIPLLSAAEKVLRRQLPLLALNDPPEWEASHAYSTDEFVYPTDPAHQGVYYYRCSTAGTSGAAGPTWPETAGQTVADGTCVWQCAQFPAQNLGKPRPFLGGWCRGVQPLYANEATSRLYLKNEFTTAAGRAWHEGDILYMDGLSIPKVAGATAIWRVVTEAPWNGHVIELLQEPKGTITLDCWGECAPGTSTPLQLLGDIARRILVLGGADSAALDGLAAGMNAAFPGTAFGINLGSWTDAQAAMDTLTSGLPLIWGVRRDGTWYARRFDPPSGTPDLALTEAEILEDGIEVEHDPEIFWKVTVRGERNHTPMTNPAETVEGWHDAPITPERLDWLSQEWREGSAENAAIRDRHPLAEAAGPHETCLAFRASCAPVSQLWLALKGAQRRLVRVTVKMLGLTVEPGDLVRVSHARLGLDNWLGRLVGVIDDHQTNEITLTLWG